jgi:hypothetical protein
VTDTTIRTRNGVAARSSAWVGHRQRELSSRIHRAGDDRARRHGWTVTEITGRFGFKARSYRDPRFDNRHRQLSPEQASAAPRVRQHQQARRGE